ncbi:hypothetical protein MXD61_25640 [Frankia sp. AgPm24]|uniref:Uncharacterized protein n=1 Tax=Frankia umida TaxID=573489 RepID=A0ABT0K3C7_9ACTN|nr:MULTISPECIES: hypothetical protein [Frankia]MCK9877788.1 hypothetical protein [Frankia umida]MCK9925214.1 hypothetical protein [Frankia sp. AgPm24]
MGTTTINAAVLAAETAEHEPPLSWWAATIVTFVAILILAAVLALMTRWERKRNPHSHS